MTKGIACFACCIGVLSLTHMVGSVWLNEFEMLTGLTPDQLQVAFESASASI